jgi:hypothetical protein
MRQAQSREVADELDNRFIGYKREQWEIRPERGANEAELHGTRRNVAELPNNSVNEPYNTQCNVVEVPGNPIEGTRRNIVEIPSNPVYELYNTRT